MKVVLRNRARSMRAVGAFVSTLTVGLILGIVIAYPAYAAQKLNIDKSCIVTVLNRTVQVSPKNTWQLNNVPSTQGQVRARANCMREGTTAVGQTDYFQVKTNQNAPVGDFFLKDNGASINAPFTIYYLHSTSITLEGIGSLFQMRVFADYPAGKTDEITLASTGTNYRSSNAEVATVNADGRIVSRAAGSALITVRNDGVVTALRVVVTDGGDRDNDGIPDFYEVENGMDPNDAVDAAEDYDGDGLANLQEFQTGTDIRLSDSDSDGLADGEELVPGADGWVSNPLLVDSDGDGVGDALEVLANTNPSNASDFNFQNILVDLQVFPSTLNFRYNMVLVNEASRQLKVTGIFVDGSTIDLTSQTLGTRYASNDLTICNFGEKDGEIFGGNTGSCSITVTNNGLQAVVPGDVNNFFPTALSRLNVSGVQNVDVEGDFAYLATNNGLTVVNVANRAAPQVVGTVNMGAAVDVKVKDGIAYVANRTAGLRIVDVTNPASPQIIGQLSTTDAVDLVVQDNIVYLADSTAGLAIIDVNIPTAPVLLGMIDNGSANGVAVNRRGRIAVVVDAAGGHADIIDISSPATPLLLSTTVSIPSPTDVDIDGNYAYVSSSTNGLMVVDFANVTAPNVWDAIAGTLFDGMLFDVQVHNNLVFGADYFFVNNVPIIDVADPTSPLQRTTVNFAALGDASGNGVAVDNSYVYLTADGALYIGQYIDVVDEFGVAPTLTVTKPTERLSLLEGGEFIVEAEASDDIAVQAVNFYIDGELEWVDATRPYRFVFDIPDGIGAHEVKVVAVDYGGNQTALAPFYFDVFADSDHDGLSNTSELMVYGTDPDNADTDHDAIRDDVEIRMNTNPLVADTDGDGLLDGEEIVLGVDGYITDPQLADTDGDGINDADEKLLHSTNPTIADTDADGLSDGDEILVHGSDPLKTDTDGDRIKDGDEVAAGASPILLDTDHDTLSDYNEIVYYKTNPGSADTDGDAMPDNYELSRSFDPKNPADGALDNDADGLTNSVEAVAGTNPFNSDSDYDLLSDHYEHTVSLTDPLKADTDNSGRSDGDELLTDGTNPQIGSDDLIIGNELALVDSNAIEWQFDDSNISDSHPVSSALSHFENTFSYNYFTKINGVRYSSYGNGVALAESGRVQNYSLLNQNGVIVSRSVFVPANEPGVNEAFMRTMTNVFNPKLTSQTVTVDLYSCYHGAENGSADAFSFYGSSQVSNEDDYLMFADSAAGGRLPGAFIVGGLGDHTDSRQVTLTDDTNYNASQFYRCGQVRYTMTIPAEQSRRLLTYQLLDNDVAGVRQQAASLHELRATALTGISDLQRGELINFCVDSDYDVICDTEEATYGTDKNNSDTDGDGLTDGFEVAYGFDPLSPTDTTTDTDGDGLDLAAENAHDTDPRNADTDGDQLNDGYEVSNGLNPIDPEDGNNTDTDGDGLKDALEVGTVGTDPLVADTDGDSLSDYFEYTYGLNPLVVTDVNSDADQDGLDLAQESANKTNPTLRDTDGDGLTDGDEVLVHNSNPLSSDTDRDQLPDAWEVENGLNPNDATDANADADGDGFSNVDEYVSGFDPFDPGSPAIGDVVWTQFNATIPSVGQNRSLYLSIDGDLVVMDNTQEESLRVAHPANAGPLDTPSVGADGSMYFRTQDYIYAFGATGEELWNYHNENTWEPESSFAPSIGGDGTLYVVGSDSSMYGRDNHRLLTLSSNGVAGWTFDTEDSIEGPAVIGGDGTIYIKTSAMLFALNADGSLHWSYPGAGEPAIGADGTAYAGVGSQLFAFNSDGSVRWRKPITGNLRHSPVIGNNGAIYVLTAYDATLHAFSANGQAVWSYHAGGAGTSPLVGPGGVIYFTTHSNIYAVNASGTVKWQRPAATPIDYEKTPVMGDGYLYVKYTNNILAAVGIETGGLANTAWPAYRHDVGKRGDACLINGSFVNDGDNDNDGLPNCFEVLNGLNPSVHADADSDADSDGLSNFEEFQIGSNLRLADSDGDALNDNDESTVHLTNPIKSDTDFDGMNDGYEVGNGFSVLDSNDALLDSDNDGFHNETEAQAGFDLLDASKKPQGGEILWQASFIENGTSTIGPNDIVYVGDYRGWVSAFNRAGFLLWSTKLNDSIASSPTLGMDGTIYVTGVRNLFALNSQGQVLWTVHGDDDRSYNGLGASLASDGTIYAPFATELVAVNTAGVEQWRYAATSEITTPAVVAFDGTIYVGADEGLSALNADGSLKWHIDLDGGFNYHFPAIGPDGTVYVSTYNDGGVLYAIAPDGTIRWSYRTNGGSIHSVIVDHTGIVYFNTNDLVHALDAQGQLLWTSAGQDDRSLLLTQSQQLISIRETTMEALNLDGSVSWSANVNDSYGASPAINSIGNIYLGDSNGFAVYAADVDKLENRAWSKLGHDSYNTNNQCFTPAGFLGNEDADGDTVSDCREWLLHMNPGDPSDAAADFDGDGLSNLEEINLGTQISNEDSDNDGLDDESEVNTYSSNPLTTDTDKDGLKDGFEIDNGFNPLTNTGEAYADADGDGFSNLQETLASSDWQDAQNAPQPGTLAWKFSMGNINPDVVIREDGSLVLASQNYLHVSPAGQLISQEVIANNARSVNSPMYAADGMHYGTYASENGLVHYLEARNNAGQLLWQKSLVAQSHWNIWAPALGPNNGVYSVSRDRLYYYSQDGNTSWNVNLGVVAMADPVVGFDGKIYVSTTSSLIAVDPVSHSKAWSYLLGTQGGAVSVGPDGTIYVGSYNDKLTAINPDGSLKWTYSTYERIFSAPVFAADGTIYVTDYDQYLHAINRDGTRKWTAYLSANSESSPAVAADGTVYVGTTGGRVIAFTSEGDEKWVYNAESSGIRFTSNVTIGQDGTVYVAAHNGKLYALIDNNGGLSRSSNWPVAGRDLSLTRNACGTLSLNTDSDSDGMNDCFEQRYGLNRNDAADAMLDLDNDGLTNSEEYTRGTNPALSDTDGDGLSDRDEINRYGTNPLTVDTDASGRSDSDELFGDATDPVNSADDLDTISLMHVMNDTGGADWELARSGEISYASNGFDDALYDGVRLSVNSTNYDNRTNVAGSLQNGRELSFSTRSMSGLLVSRRAYVPNPGDAFIRYVEKFHNPTTAAITVNVKLRSTYANMGHPQRLTSSGDTALTSGDDYVIYSDTDPNAPVVRHVFAARYGDLRPTNNSSASSSQWTVDFAVTVPAGETVDLMHFMSIHSSVSEAQTSLENVYWMEGSALNGLSTQDQAAIRNVYPYVDADHDGVSDEQEAVLGTDPANADSDNDGLTDGEEIRLGVNPLVADTTPPVVNLIKPMATDEVIAGQQMTVSVDATDDGRVAEVIIYLDGVEQQRLTQPPFTTSISVPANANSTVDIEAVAKDTNNNMQSSGVTTVNVIAATFATIEGRLVFENSENEMYGVPEITVAVSGTNLSAVTDANGNFLIENVSNALSSVSLVTSGFIGQQEVVVHSATIALGTNSSVDAGMLVLRDGVSFYDGNYNSSGSEGYLAASMEHPFKFFNEELPAGTELQARLGQIYLYCPQDVCAGEIRALASYEPYDLGPHAMGTATLEHETVIDWRRVVHPEWEEQGVSIHTQTIFKENGEIWMLYEGVDPVEFESATANFEIGISSVQDDWALTQFIDLGALSVPYQTTGAGFIGGLYGSGQLGDGFDFNLNNRYVRYTPQNNGTYTVESGAITEKLVDSDEDGTPDIEEIVRNNKTTLNGRVVFDDGAEIYGLPGITVTLAEYNLSIATDADGYFTLADVPSYQAVTLRVQGMMGAQEIDLTKSLKVLNDSHITNVDTFVFPAGQGAISFQTGNGTDLNLGDDSATSVALNHAFNFYGVPYSTIYVGSNGHITFESQFSGIFPNLQLQPTIYALSSDWNPSEAGYVTTESLSDRTIVTWLDVAHYNAGGINRYQVILQETGEITLVYDTIDAGVELQNSRIGISNGQNSAGMQIDYSLEDGSVFRNDDAPYEAIDSSNPFDLAGSYIQFVPTVDNGYQVNIGPLGSASSVDLVDTDDDGVADIKELLVGTDPNDALSF